MTSPVAITSEPIDGQRCKFILSRPVDRAPGVHRFSSIDEAAGTPLAESVLSVPGISEVILSGNVVTVVKDTDVEWCDLDERVRYAISAAVEEADSSPELAGEPVEALDDQAMYEQVAEIFEAQINPAVAQHGGLVELIDVQDATVIVRMMGGCQGCGMANVTLRQGIEASLRRVIPGLRGIEDVTDHSAGSNPYFASEKQ
jgi:Fe-S cluster biogenesis protein NfuA